MSLLCELFGHKRPLSGWFGDGLHGRISYDAIDNVGRVHMSIYHVCPRCGVEHRAARFHATSPKIMDALAFLEKGEAQP